MSAPSTKPKDHSKWVISSSFPDARNCFCCFCKNRCIYYLAKL